jgi:4-hydroxybenzoate polyprenyltransferase
VALAAHTPPPWWLVTAGAALGVGAHFANVLADLDDDVATGVHGLPQRVGTRWSTAIAAVMLLAASVLLAWGPAGPPSAVALAGLSLVVVVLLSGGTGKCAVRTAVSRSARHGRRDDRCRRCCSRPGPSLR